MSNGAISRDVVLGTRTCTRVQPEYRFWVLVFVLVLVLIVRVLVLTVVLAPSVVKTSLAILNDLEWSWVTIAKYSMTKHRASRSLTATAELLVVIQIQAKVQLPGSDKNFVLFYTNKRTSIPSTLSRKLSLWRSIVVIASCRVLEVDK